MGSSQADRNSTVRLTKGDNLLRSAGSLAEHGLDAGLSAFFAVAAGNAHRADDLAVKHDGNRTGLREVPHDVGRCQILALAHDLARLRARPAPTQSAVRPPQLR